MKKSLFLTGILALALVFGLALIGCGDGSGDGDGTGNGGGTVTTASFAGTWNASGNRSIIFTGSSFTYKVNGTTQYQGTFSVSGSTITFNESSLGMASGNFSLSAGDASTGSTLTLSNHTWDSSVNGTYTKEGGTTDTVAIPTATPAGGTYTTAQSVTLACSTSGATIHYTTNGDTPTASSTAYTTAINISTTTTLKAIAIKDGMTTSGIFSATYTIGNGSSVGSDLVLDDGWAWTFGYGDGDIGTSGYIFKSDGTCLYIVKDLRDSSPWEVDNTRTYTATDGILSMSPGPISYSISGNTLTLGDGWYTLTKTYVGSLGSTPTAKYIITGRTESNGTAFTATINGAPMRLATISTVITAIRTDANGADCEIQFGDGTDVLDILSGIQFNNTGGTWGTVTITGKITSTNSNNTIRVNDVTIISTADIANTNASSYSEACTVTGGTITINGGTVGRISAGSNGTITINNGTISSTGLTLSTTLTKTGNVITGSTININGGTIENNGSANTDTLISNEEGSTINISGGTIKSTGTAKVINAGTLTISGGTISSATTLASSGTVYNNGTNATTTITGGTIQNTASGYAVYKNSGTVTISTGATIDGNRYGVD